MRCPRIGPIGTPTRTYLVGVNLTLTLALPLTLTLTLTRYADSDLRSPSPPLSPNQCAPNGLALGSNDPSGSTLPRSLTGWGDEASDARRNAAPSGASAPGASAPPNPNPNP